MGVGPTQLIKIFPSKVLLANGSLVSHQKEVLYVESLVFSQASFVCYPKNDEADDIKLYSHCACIRLT